MTFETKLRNFIGRLKNSKFSEVELEVIGDELLREYNEERKVLATQWQGKSSFTLNQVGDKIIVIKYQRPEKDAEPKEIKTEIKMEELRRLNKLIIEMSKNTEECLTSRDLGEKFYHSDWDKEIFPNRKRHNKFTIMLNVLDKKEIIEYRGGRIYLK